MEKKNILELQLEMNQIKEKILTQVISACAGAFYNINLTKNIIPGAIYQTLDGVEYNINKQIGMPENSCFTELMNYWGRKLSKTEQEEYFAFFNPDYLINCYKSGKRHVVHSYWTSDSIGGKMLAEHHIILYEDLLNGDILGAAYIIDKTDIHTLKNNEISNYNIIANAGLGIWSIIIEDDRKPRMKANTKTLEILGLKDRSLSEENVYEYWFSRIYEEDIKLVQVSVDEMLKGSLSEHTYRWYHPVKGIIYMRCGGTLSISDDCIRVVKGYHSDVTDVVINDKIRQEELKTAKEAAEKANAAKTSFLSRMSHDIRTPLNGIIGLLEINEKHPEDIELLSANRSKMLVTANYLLMLINDILQMSKLESGEILISNECISLIEIVREVTTIIEQRASEAGITLEYCGNYEKVKSFYVYGSKLHIKQIFLNIYGNCIKYNKMGGKVTTDFKCLFIEDNVITYQWTISDTGIGMSEEYIEHIFEPFSQEHYDARSVYKGTGLGMAIVKTLIDKMGGTIEVTSKENIGSSFTVTIPFIIANKAEFVNNESIVNNDNRNNKALSINGLNLLLAEDNELNAEIAQVLLEDEGAHVDVVENGKQAVEVFLNSSAGTFDAILMDIMMPIMDGITATKQIRKSDKEDAAKIPIIAMTANAFDEDAKMCIDAGMNAHMTKPIQIDIITSTIANLCRN